MGHTANEQGATPGRHVPVLLHELLNVFSPKPGDRFIDATLGDGGHSEALLNATSPDGRVLGIDRDAAMLERASERLAPFGDRFIPIHANFAHLLLAAKGHDFLGVDGILFDFGVASWHFDASSRGFSFQGEQPLDMRLSPTRGGETAADLLNHASREELEEIFRTYGEEPEAGKIANAIVRRRPISTTHMLNDIIREAKRQRPKHHHATRVFQALRIAVNKELDAVQTALPESLQAVRVGGVIATMAYHSLEDRLVKRYFKDQVSQGTLELLWKKPMTPSEEELSSNPRARSAKFRAARLIKPFTL